MDHRAWLYDPEPGSALQARPLRFASYLLINVYTVKTRQVRLFIRLKRDLSVSLTFPPVHPAARSGTAFRRGRHGPIGAEGILKKRVGG